MAKQGKFYGEVKDNKLHLDNKSIYDLWLQTMNGKRVELTIKKESENVSQDQWGYLYACVYTPLAEETGYTVEETDGVLKKLFLTRNKGTKKEYVKEKSKLNKEEIAKYIDYCIKVAAENGIVVLPANKFWRKVK